MIAVPWQELGTECRHEGIVVGAEVLGHLEDAYWGPIAGPQVLHLWVDPDSIQSVCTYP